MRRIIALCAVAAVAALAGACAGTGDQPVRTAGMPGQLEPIHAAAFTRDTAVFWVSSNGCTSKADVKPFITRLRDSAVITLRRLDEDRCENPKSDGVQLQWSFEELGLPPGAEVSVNNPYLMRQNDKPHDAS
ncbi:hypothetical protein ACQKKG_08545 [Brevundimonas sp. NPDC003935]|uniref:hypothetical protein n=1 Tax=unclassified Brevundimonas TaxID=2622653 RepID=UPI0028967FA1|nr:hypothetical protein [Brevundimonas sp.]